MLGAGRETSRGESGESRRRLAKLDDSSFGGEMVEAGSFGTLLEGGNTVQATQVRRERKEEDTNMFIRT